MCRLKGRVALKSLPARFTPPGKAVRGILLSTHKMVFQKSRWLGGESGRLFRKMTGGFGINGGKEAFMSGNAEKTKFSIRVDTELIALADAYIKDSTVRTARSLWKMRCVSTWDF